MTRIIIVIEIASVTNLMNQGGLHLQHLTCPYAKLTRDEKIAVKEITIIESIT
jgi:hypothetical protein